MMKKTPARARMARCHSIASDFLAVETADDFDGLFDEFFDKFTHCP